MKTDKLAYILLQLAPQGFFELIGRNPDDALRYEFKSVELKELRFASTAYLFQSPTTTSPISLKFNFNPMKNSMLGSSRKFFSTLNSILLATGVQL